MARQVYSDDLGLRWSQGQELPSTWLGTDISETAQARTKKDSQDLTAALEWQRTRSTLLTTLWYPISFCWIWSSSQLQHIIACHLHGQPEPQQLEEAAGPLGCVQDPDTGAIRINWNTFWIRCSTSSLWQGTCKCSLKPHVLGIAFGLLPYSEDGGFIFEAITNILLKDQACLVEKLAFS